jgi:D-3-phosphoglycerate dehydrogenase
MTTILAAGDHFILPAMFEDAIRSRAPSGTTLTFKHFQSPWPAVPFGDVGEVTEASGSEAEMIAALAGADIMVANHAPLTECIIRASDLKFAVIARGGVTNANLAAATAAGLVISNAPGRNAAATAEHTLALMLAVLRRIPDAHAELRGGVWRGDLYEYSKSGLELGSAQLGLIGYGQIGSRVARMALGFGARIRVYDPYVDARNLPDHVQQTDLDTLLANSTIVSLHARAGAETHHILNAATIARMPAGSVVINCARGSLLDYDALCDALESGHLFGAGLDVFDQEPIPPGNQLLTARNLVITPHIAGASRETAATAARIAGEEVARYLSGQPLHHALNEVPARGGPPSCTGFARNGS